MALSFALKSCEDRISDSPNCALYADSCSQPEKVVHCQRYCGICKGDSNIQLAQSYKSKTVVANDVCIDKSRLCQYQKKYCQTSARVREYCRRTCGQCNNRKQQVFTEKPTMRSTFTTTTSSTRKESATPTTISASTMKQTKTTEQTKTTKRTKPAGQTTLIAAPPARRRLDKPVCNPNIPDSPNCFLQPNVCTEPGKKVLCQRFCGLCLEKPSTQALTTTSTSAVPTTMLKTTTKKPKKCADSSLEFCSLSKLHCKSSGYIRLTCRKTCNLCDSQPTTTTRTTLAMSTTTTVNTDSKLKLLQKTKVLSTSTEQDVKECINLTNFLCPMFKCLTGNTEFKKLCDQQSVYICNKN